MGAQYSLTTITNNSSREIVVVHVDKCGSYPVKSCTVTPGSVFTYEDFGLEDESAHDRLALRINGEDIVINKDIDAAPVTSSATESEDTRDNITFSITHDVKGNTNVLITNKLAK